MENDIEQKIEDKQENKQENKQEDTKKEDNTKWSLGQQFDLLKILTEMNNKLVWIESKMNTLLERVEKIEKENSEIYDTLLIEEEDPEKPVQIQTEKTFWQKLLN